MKNIRGLVVMKTAPLDLKGERLKELGLKGEGLVNSSARSWTVSRVPNLNALFMENPPPETEMKKHLLAAVVEGEFPSYFKGKPIPEREMEKGKERSPAQRLPLPRFRWNRRGLFWKRENPAGFS